MNLTFKLKTCAIITILALLWSCQKGGTKKKKADSGRTISEDALIGTRVLRNAPQYLAASAKILEMNPSDLSEDAGYETIKNKLPNSINVTENSLSDGSIVAASKIAANGCIEYIKKDPEDSLDVFLEKLVAKAEFDPSKRQELFLKAEAIIDGSSIAEQKNQTEIDQAKLTTCSYVVVVSGLLF